MGDALLGVDVREAKLGTELDTIDGTAEPGSEPGLIASARPAMPKPATDYPELVTVERRHYQIAREIAQGGMGRVLEARDLRLGRAVAIKELLPKNRDAARRFEREARITARLQHPAIIHVYEAGVWAGGEPFYAMTKVSGRSLDKVVAERKTLAERLALVPNVIAVADALAYAHNEHIIHRDLKPANVLVGGFGETVVIDWGLAKDLGAPPDPQESLQLRTRQLPELAMETNAGSVIGTPAYMPPEQARGESVDQRADVYALGSLLYHVLVGAAPYSGATGNEVLEQVKTQPCRAVRAREPGAPADLVAIVDKAMARDPADRYADAGELAQDLARFQTGQLVAAHHYTPPQLFWRWLRRHRIAVAVAVIAMIALVVGGAVSVSRILHAQAQDARRRIAQLEERGRVDLLAGHAGRAMASLVGAARDGERGGARGFLLAEAMRPFEAEVAELPAGTGPLGVAYSPDGRRIATTGRRGVTLWTVAGGRERVIGDGPTSAVAFDHRGAQLVIAGDRSTLALARLDGSVRALGAYPGEILDVDFSADDTLLAVVGTGPTQVWELATATVHEVQCHSAPILAVRFSPVRSDLVATAGADRLGCLWNWTMAPDADNPGPFTTLLRGHGDRVQTIRWSSDGAHLLTASADGTARLWSPEMGKPVMAELRHESGLGITSAELSADGTRVVTASLDGTAIVWEIPDELPEDVPTTRATPLRKLGDGINGHGDAIEHAGFGLDDTRIATAGRDGAAKLWDADTGQPIASFEHSDAVTAVRFGADPTRVVTASQDGTARVWDITRGIAIRWHDLHAAVNGVAIASTGAIAAVRDDGKVDLWAPGAREPSVLRDHMGRLYAVAFSVDGTRLYTAGEEPEILAWNVATATRVGALGPHADTIRALAAAPDGSLASAGDEGIVRVWSAAGRLVRELGVPGGVTALAYAGDGTLFAVGSDGDLSVWRAGATQPVRVRRTTSPTRAIALAPDGHSLAIAGAFDTRIVAYDRGTLGAERLRLDGPTGEVRTVAFTTDGSRVITAGTDGAAKLWDAAKGKLLATRDAHGGPITAVAVDPDGRALWVASADNYLRAWDIRVETRPATELARFLAQRVRWQLGDDDVVRLTAEGDRDGQR
ncbi:MAG TPA: serine/threonine-protein kinase [Kofleriaceae bacterium]|nr:serine/threonine-protein kinase [Kofleriaceae bacterium]